MSQVDPLRLQRGRNPITHQAHNREVFQQITIPLIIGGLLVLLAAVGVVLTGIRGQGDIHRWAGVSLIWLILPMMVFAFLLLVLTAGLVYAVTRLLGVLPPFARQVQDAFVLVQLRVSKVSDSLVEPVLRTQQNLASLSALRRRKRRP
jgi:hypothetical protein